MAALLEALPAFTSLEQFESHQSATPDTFQIAPVLRRKVENCSMVLRPNKIDGLSYAETGISGDLYLSEGSLVFWSGPLNAGLNVPYPAITLHAISRTPMKPWVPQADPETADASDNQPNPEANGEHPEDLTAEGTNDAGGPCIFCQIDTEADQEEDEEYESTDLILTPPEGADIEGIFADLCHCASLFPSTMSDDDEPQAALGAGQMDDADEEESNDQVGATMTADDWDAKIDWSTAPKELQPGFQQQQEENFEDAAEEEQQHQHARSADAANAAAAQPEPKKPRLE